MPRKNSLSPKIRKRTHRGSVTIVGNRCQIFVGDPEAQNDDQAQAEKSECLFGHGEGFFSEIYSGV